MQRHPVGAPSAHPPVYALETFGGVCGLAQQGGGLGTTAKVFFMSVLYVCDRVSALVEVDFAPRVVGRRMRSRSRHCRGRCTAAAGSRALCRPCRRLRLLPRVAERASPPQRAPASVRQSGHCLSRGGRRWAGDGRLASGAASGGGPARGLRRLNDRGETRRTAAVPRPQCAAVWCPAARLVAPRS